MKKETNPLILLLLLNLLITFLYVLLSKEQSLSFFADEKEYVQLADNALHGNFNFDIGRFVRSPLYVILLAAIKWIFGGLWLQAIIVFQVLFQGVACIGLYFLAKEVFDKQTAVISAVLFSVFIPCFYYVKAISTETIYQANYLWLLYFFLLSLKKEHIKYVIITSILFAIAYLNRSQIALFAPFILIGYLFRSQIKLSTKITNVALFITIAFIITLPWAILNFKLHNEFITSSNGSSWVFIAGNSNTGYAQFIENLDMNSKKYKDAQNLEYSIPKEMGDTTVWKKNVKEKEQLFNAYGKKWVKENPKKFLEIKAKLAALFFVPGLMKKHHSFKTWLLSFILSFPFYLMAYIGMIISFKRKFRAHLWFICYGITIFILMVLFVFSSRFRTYGIEALYLMYAAVTLSLLLDFFRTKVSGRLHL